MKKLKVLFLGQKPIGERCFSILTQRFSDTFEVCGVVSNKSKNVWWQSNDIFVQAQKLNLPFVDNEKRNNKEIHALVNTTNPDIIICTQHPWILEASVLKAVNYFSFNLHNAKLPDYKGNNSCNHTILNKEKKYTCTLHWLADEVDMGDICYEESFSIEHNDTTKSLYEKSYVAGQKLFIKLLNTLKDQKLPPKTKITEKGTFYSRNSIESMKGISSFKNLTELDLKSRAFFFPVFEKAFCNINGIKFTVTPEYNFSEKLQLKNIT